jgi:hypothetical protein
MTFPVIDHDPVRLPTLVGQMVFLHAIEQGAAPPRVSTDLDVLVNARIAGRPLAAFASGLEDLGFEQDGISPDGIAHRYRRNRATIDVLAPQGLGQRTDLTTTPPGRTIPVPGGTQPLSVSTSCPQGIADR